MAGAKLAPFMVRCTGPGCRRWWHLPAGRAASEYLCICTSAVELVDWDAHRKTLEQAQPEVVPVAGVVLLKLTA